MSIAGINAVGGRSVAEIAERFLEQAALGASAKLPRDVRALIERFLAIAGEPDEAAAALRALAGEGNMTAALAPAIDLFETRTGFLAARGIDLQRDALLDRLRPRLRLLHRLRLRTDRR